MRTGRSYSSTVKVVQCHTVRMRIYRFLDKHKDKPIPYKYQKWKARETQKRELESNGGIPLPEKKTGKKSWRFEIS